MRILHMIPDIGISNGIMSVILNYAKAMPKDIVFDVVYFKEKQETKQAEIEALGGRVYKINTPSPKSALNREMDKFFAMHKNEWQALHINAPHFTVFIANAAKRAGIKKICCHCHSTAFSLNANNLKRNELLNKPTSFLVDKKFACSKEAGEYWFKKNFTVLNNAIDCEKYRFNSTLRIDVREKLNLNDNYVVGHIGRTDISQKNHSFLLEVFAKIYRKNNKAVLLLVGAEPTQELTDVCKKYKIEDAVRFLGVRRDVNELLMAMDVFVFPSINEGLPVSVIEAQAAGLPAIISDSITNEVIVNDDMVSAVPLSESADVWAEKILTFSGERADTYDIMKSAGWDIYDCAEKLVKYYKNID